ncbi:MAG: hypothetical protein JNL94_08880 [Planctomycetes bacterium]|nr:hypothetical protein [Planctomycetota bacterium]
MNSDGRTDIVVASESAALTMVLNQSSAAYVLAYGSNPTQCKGSGGFVPRLQSTCCPAPNQTITITLDRALGGSSAIAFFGLTQSAIPIPGTVDCFLRVAPLLPLSFSLPLFGSGPGNGAISFPATIPPGSFGVAITMQAFVLDPGGQLGFTASNGLEIFVP